VFERLCPASETTRRGTTKVSKKQATTCSSSRDDESMVRMFKGATGRVFAILCLMYFLTYVDRVNLSVAAPLIKQELGLNNAQLGLALSAFGVCYSFLQIVNGFLGDRFGPRRVLCGLGTLWGLGTLLTGLVTGLPGLLASRILVGLGEAGTIPTSTRAMSNWLPAARRGLGQGMTHSAARLAAAATPPIVVAMIPFVGWRGAFVVLGAASLCWVALWWFYFRDDPREHKGVTAEELAELPPYRTGVPVKDVPWRRLIPRILPATLVFFCHAWTLWVFLTWLPSFLVNRYGFDLKQSALFTSLIFLAGMCGDTAGGLLTDYLYKKTGDLNRARRDAVIVGFLVSLLAMSMVFVVDHQAVIIASLAISLFFLEMTEGPVWAVPMDIAPRYAGVAGGFISTAAGLGSLLSPVAFGYVTDLTGSFVLPFAMSIGLLGIGIVLSFFMRPDRPIEDEPAPAIVLNKVAS
jgi:sugar phosphate permease